MQIFARWRMFSVFPPLCRTDRNALQSRWWYNIIIYNICILYILWFSETSLNPNHLHDLNQDLQTLFHGGHLDHQGALLAVTLAHLRSPQRIPATGAAVDQWQRLRILLGTMAYHHGLCSVSVERVELKGVATEFWMLGEPGSKRLENALKKQLQRVEGSWYSFEPF